MINIQIINPPHYYCKGEKPIITFPLGLGYIASILIRNNFSVKVLDCVGEAPNTKSKYKAGYLLGLKIKEIYTRIQNLEMDIVLISCPFSSQYDCVCNIMQIIKAHNNHTKIIVGGSHASACAYSVLKNPNVDFVILGEGELPVLNLLRAILNNKSYGGLKSIGFKIDNQLHINRKLNLINNLDIIPFPAWELFPIETYITSSHKHTLISTKNRTMELITSRGCPYDCSFCASHVISGKIWRPRTITNVINEIKQLKQQYNIQEIHFVDDNIALDKTRFEMLCHQLTELRMKWTVPNGIKIQHLNHKLIKLMKQSGCYALFLPIESANKKIIETHMNNKISIDHLHKMAIYAKRYKLYIVGFFIIGFHEESRKDIENTISFSTKLHLDEAHFSIITPLPGSKYYMQHIDKLDNFLDYSAKKANLPTKYLTKDEIQSLRNKAYIKFEFIKFLRNPISYFSEVQFNRLYRYSYYYMNNIWK